MFSPCPQPESVRVRNVLNYCATETALIFTGSTQVTVSLCAHGAATWCQEPTSSVLFDRNAPYLSGTSFAASSVMNNLGGGEEDESEPAENVLEFRSLPPTVSSLGGFVRDVRLSSTASEYARSRRGQVVRVESDLEEEPE